MKIETLRICLKKTQKSPGLKQHSFDTIYYNWKETGFGEILIMGDSDGICGLSFRSSKSRQDLIEEMVNRWKPVAYIKNNEFLDEWFSNLLKYSGKIKIQLVGTFFQLKVWEMLLKIPKGSTATYAEIALLIGSPKSARAVGNAVSQNPIGWIVPCHRVLPKSGGIGGYFWGVNLKKQLLESETSQHLNISKT